MKKHLSEAIFLQNEYMRRHYYNHVLQPDEEFDPANPKFPPMSQEEYMSRAEALSLAPAGRSTSNDEIIGFAVFGKRGDWTAKYHKYVKIKRHSDLVKGYSEVVICNEDSEGEEYVYTYMLSRRSKFYSLYRDFYSELKENQ